MDLFKRRYKSKKNEILLSSEDTMLKSNTSFSIVEAYKTLRTNLIFLLSAAEKKSFIVTSAEPSSGKSSVCSNLAITLVQLEKNVIIVDADLRKPRLHKLFKVDNKQGLTTVLSNQCSISDTPVYKINDFLDFIPSGPIPPNPSELLGTRNMNSLVSALEKKYDYVIIDTPPVGITTDALMIIKDTAGALLVTRCNQTSYDDIKKSIESIRGVDGHVLGLVLNDVNKKNAYYDYDYKYAE